MSDADYDPYYAMVIRCNQCGDQFTIHHPDEPDDHVCVVVIHDDTLNPEDFGGQQ